MIYEHLLQESGLTKTQLSEHLGITKQTLSRYGNNPPKYVLWGLQNYVRAKQSVAYFDALRKIMVEWMK